MRTALTLTLFVVTLVLVVRRPRGIGSAWWTSIGAAVALALGLVRPGQEWAVTVVARDALLFLLALLLLSGLLMILDRPYFLAACAVLLGVLWATSPARSSEFRFGR